MAERFLRTCPLFWLERNISWIELTRKCLRGEFSLSSGLNRYVSKDFVTTKMEQQNASKSMGRKVVQVLDL